VLDQLNQVACRWKAQDEAALVAASAGAAEPIAAVAAPSGGK
jgi:hypothetical protein